MQNKVNLRQTLLAARDALSASARAHSDFAIGEHVINWLIDHPVQTLGVYWPIRNEPDLRNIYSAIAERGIQLALPVAVGKDMPLKFFAWMPGEELVKDSMGVPAPLASRAQVQPDAILAPCLGFNAALNRLGYGKGFYDRTLAVAPRPIAIGIAYALSETAFEGASHDVALDAVITEKTILSAK